MKFIIRRDAKILGTLFFDGELYHFEGDQAFAAELATMVRAGIPTKQEESFEDKFVLFEKIVNSREPLFPFALIDHLRNQGFGVEELLIEIEHQFHKYMSLIPKDTALYRDSMQQWALMSLLEKTYLLDILQKDKMFSGTM